jgi:triphosphatase
MQHETELKISLSKEELLELEALLSELRPAVGLPLKKQNVLTIYFDTPGLNLRSAGISLRLRRESRGWLQTVKLKQDVGSGLSNPIEIETRVKGRRPDLDAIAEKEVRSAIEQEIETGGPLQAVFETVVERTTRKLRLPNGVVEIAIDQGEVRAGPKRKAITEIELELKSGRAEAILQAADKLLPGRAVEFSTRSKAERGYRLILEKHGDNPEPEKARFTDISAKHTLAQSSSLIVAAVARQIYANRRALLETADPEAAHQLRVGLTRLRSLQRGLRPWLARGPLGKFEDVVRDVGRCVGRLRDADVLILTLVPAAENAASNTEGFSDLQKTLGIRRETIRKTVRAFLRGPAWTQLQLHLALWPSIIAESKANEQPVADAATQMIEKMWKKATRLARRLDELEEEERHDLRKLLKKLRYVSEFFAPLFPRRKVKRFIKRLKSLQDVFGAVNDARLASTLVGLSTRETPAPSVAAAYTAGWQENAAANVWAGAKLHWKALEDEAEFWK